MAITVYATRADLGRFGVPVAALSGTPTDDQDAALATASSVIDQALRTAGYALPLEAVGVDVTRAAAIIAAYDLMSVRGYNPELPGDDQLRLRYEDVLKWLSAVAAESIRPGVTEGAGGAVSPARVGGGPQVLSSSQRGYSGRSDYPVITYPHRGFTGGFRGE